MFGCLKELFDYVNILDIAGLGRTFIHYISGPFTESACYCCSNGGHRPCSCISRACRQQSLIMECMFVGQRRICGTPTHSIGSLAFGD